MNDLEKEVNQKVCYEDLAHVLAYTVDKDNSLTVFDASSILALAFPWISKEKTLEDIIEIRRLRK